MHEAKPVRIIWHHVGREHGLNGAYAPDLRLNTPEVVAFYLAEKAKGVSPNRCYRIDPKTMVELPPEGSKRCWLIVYFLDRNLQMSIGYKPHTWWLADVVSYRISEFGAIVVRDLMLDVEIDESLQYRVLDRDQFEFAVQEGIISDDEALIATTTLENLIRQLDSGSFPDARLSTIIDRYLPNRRQPRI